MMLATYVPKNETEYLLDSGLGNCTESHTPALIGAAHVVSSWVRCPGCTAQVVRTAASCKHGHVPHRCYAGLEML